MVERTRVAKTRHGTSLISAPVLAGTAPTAWTNHSHARDGLFERCRMESGTELGVMSTRTGTSFRGLLRMESDRERLLPPSPAPGTLGPEAVKLFLRLKNFTNPNRGPTRMQLEVPTMATGTRTACTGESRALVTPYSAVLCCNRLFKNSTARGRAVTVSEHQARNVHVSLGELLLGGVRLVPTQCRVGGSQGRLAAAKVAAWTDAERF
jgi:hypothetical protein